MRFLACMALAALLLSGCAPIEKFLEATHRGGCPRPGISKDTCQERGGYWDDKTACCYYSEDSPIQPKVGIQHDPADRIDPTMPPKSN
jgi:hypothetical protein